MLADGTSVLYVFGVKSLKELFKHLNLFSEGLAGFTVEEKTYTVFYQAIPSQTRLYRTVIGIAT